MGNHRLKLENIPHKEQLLSSERFTHVSRVHSQQFIHKVYYICSDHRYFINDDEFQTFNNLAQLFGIFHATAQPVYSEFRIIGQ